MENKLSLITMWVVILSLGLAAGCASAPIPYRNVNFEDGLYDEELLSIAAHELEMSPDHDRFSPRGHFERNRFTRCMDNHLLAVFPSNKMFSPGFYYVIVDKRTGDVARAGRMLPERNSWAVIVRDIDGCYE